jgi:hypothetical protein
VTVGNGSAGYPSCRNKEIVFRWYARILIFSLRDMLIRASSLPQAPLLRRRSKPSYSPILVTARSLYSTTLRLPFPKGFVHM